MSTHKIIPITFYPTFGSHTPIKHLADGDVVEVNLIDAHGCGPQEERLTAFSNPLVGPFFVDGLKPGDALSVSIEQVQPDRAQGWSYATPKATTFDPVHVVTMPIRKIVSWTIDPSFKFARLSEPAAELSGLQIPLNPMIGCLGVAPDKSQAITSYSSGNFGGNMDCPLITTGCKVKFPVFVEGGLLFIGDMHAAQSHGEISGAGIEISGNVRFSVQIEKNKMLLWPRGENTDSIFCIGSGRPLDLALQHATSEMVRYLAEEFSLTEENACVVMSQSARYMICNAVNDSFTIACQIARSVLSSISK